MAARLRLLAEDPRKRRTAKDAKVEASKLQDALLEEASNMESATAVPPRARDPSLIPSRRRYALQAPLGLIVEEDGGVRVAEVSRAATPRNWARRASATCCYP